MKVLKIDVKTKTVSEITIGKNLENIYKEIGNGCELFCCPIDFDFGDTLYADDESLLRNDIEGCFMLPEWNHPIVGNALIIGTDEEGDSEDVKMTPDFLQKKLIWGNKQVAEQYRDYALSNMIENSNHF